MPSVVWVLFNTAMGEPYDVTSGRKPKPVPGAYDWVRYDCHKPKPKRAAAKRVRKGRSK